MLVHDVGGNLTRIVCVVSCYKKLSNLYIAYKLQSNWLLCHIDFHLRDDFEYPH